MTWPASPRFQITNHAKDRFARRIEDIYLAQCPDRQPSVTQWLCLIIGDAYRNGKREIGRGKMRVQAHGLSFVLALDSKRANTVNVVTILPIGRSKGVFTEMRKGRGKGAA